jgi:DNA (cytosine-5)-methyltransferase 1
MKVMNAYCGLGGNRAAWPDYVKVTAIDTNEECLRVYADRFPQDEIVLDDAHSYILDHHEEYQDGLLWTSPPCQSHGRMMKASRHDTKKYFDASLWQEIVLLQHFHTGKWVVENTRSYYEPLYPAQSVGRHQFWANFLIRAQDVHMPDDFIFLGTVADTQKLKDFHNCQYEGNIYMPDGNGGKNHCPGQALRNMVPYQVGLDVFNSAMDDSQQEMFA